MRRRMKRPKKTMTPSLDKRVQIVLDLVVAADNRMDYMRKTLNELVKHQLAQDAALSLIYDTLVELGTPFHVKLWRWVKGKRCKS